MISLQKIFFWEKIVKDFYLLWSINGYNCSGTIETSIVSHVFTLSDTKISKTKGFLVRKSKHTVVLEEHLQNGHPT